MILDTIKNWFGGEKATSESAANIAITLAQPVLTNPECESCEAGVFRPDQFVLCRYISDDANAPPTCQFLARDFYFADTNEGQV
jgi:hypothetical protein